MTPDDFLKLLDNPDFISGIYNYCDRWCERCKMTSKCSLYASEQIVDKEFEGSGYTEQEMFFKKLESAFSMTFQLIERASAEQGIDLNFTDEIHLQITQFHGCCNPADGVVLMCERRAKRDVEIAALVTDGQLDHIAIVAGQDALHGLNISIKFGFSLRVTIIVNARETQE